MSKVRRKYSAAKRAASDAKKHPKSNAAILELAEKTLTLAAEILKELEKAEEKKAVLDKALMLLFEHDQNTAQSKMFVPSRHPSKFWPHGS